MTAKEYLRQLKTLDNMITAKLLERERIRALATRVSTNLTEKVQGAGKNSMEDAVIKATELEEQISTDIIKLFGLKEEATELIGRIDDENSKIILSMYYISNATFEQVAENTDISSRWVRKIHGKALKKFEEIYNCSC
jgi:hypothetical protein|nr:MAG TPA: Protein of unknown function (DUF1492) [Caudoviricetes sp.]